MFIKKSNCVVTSFPYIKPGFISEGGFITDMSTQNFANHRRFVTGYHKILNPLLLIGLLAGLYNFKLQWSLGGMFNDGLIVLLFICMLLLSYFARTFALKAQDRAIRAEESLRFYILSGKPLPRSLTIHQIAALRFAGDEELPALTHEAAEQQLKPEEIKQRIRQWRPDEHRV